MKAACHKACGFLCLGDDMKLFEIVYTDNGEVVKREAFAAGDGLEALRHAHIVAAHMGCTATVRATKREGDVVSPGSMTPDALCPRMIEC